MKNPLRIFRGIGDSGSKELELELKLNHWLIFQTAILGLVMITSNVANFEAPTIPAALPEIAAPAFELKKIPESKVKKMPESKEKNLTAEEYIKNYFSDIPIMVEIARCESRFRQYDKNGEVLRGEKNNLDRGIMQINEYYHNEDSEKLGYDILTIEGNTSYARRLFEKYGVKPWTPSFKCWGRTVAYSEYKEFKELAMN